MDKVFLSSELLAYLFGEMVVLLILFVAFFWSVKIYKEWDFSSLSASQYLLEKRSYFTTVALYFLLFVKFLLLLFFTHTIDALSNIVPGAMCGAGVIGANEFGIVSYILKLIVIFLGVCWIVIHGVDVRSDYRFFKAKYRLFFVIFPLAVLESLVVVWYFLHISTELPVQCCSVIYGVSDSGSSIPFGLSLVSLGVVTLGIVVALLSSLVARSDQFAFVFGGLLLYFGYYAILHIVGIYVYELPTHICPFCMLQKEYYFVGYLLWGTLFMGSFVAMSPFVLKFFINQEVTTPYKIGTILVGIVSLVSIYIVVGYYLRNGTWL